MAMAIYVPQVATCGFFLPMNINRTTFLVDGFNLYHSLKQASHELGGKTTRWLNLDSLCKAYLYKVGNNAQLESVIYFSALAHHLTPQDKYLVKRHQDYISCLESVGVTVELGRFKKKHVRCRHCGQTTVHHEEKETDVAIALKLFELLMNNECDTVVLFYRGYWTWLPHSGTQKGYSLPSKFSLHSHTKDATLNFKS